MAKILFLDNETPQVSLLLQLEILKILDENTEEDTLTPDAGSDFENDDVLLEDLEWDPDSSAMKLES